MTTAMQPDSGGLPNGDGTSSPAPVPQFMTWPGMSAGVTASISGGGVSVNTDDLAEFSSTLRSAATSLDDADDHMATALAEVQAAPEPAPPAGPLVLPANPVDATDLQVLGSAVMAAMGEDNYSFELKRSNAINAINDARTGSGSLQNCALELRILAAEVTACASSYTTAESQAHSSGGGRGGGSTWQSVADVAAAATVPSLVMWSHLLYGISNKGRVGTSTSSDAIEALRIIFGDAKLGSWVGGDLVTLAVLINSVQSASSGQEADEVSDYLARTAPGLDTRIRSSLPDTIQVGSRTVDTDSLTPVQRVAAYLAMASAARGVDIHGPTTGVTVTPHGGQAVTVPPAAKDPFGLKTEVAPMSGSAAAGTPVTAPRTASEVIRHSDQVMAQDTDDSSGVISILKTTDDNGCTTWMVIIPGTADWGSGGSNPMDLQTNLEGVAGMPTDMESAVVTAMRQAGVQPGEEVGLYGHSQGGIVAANIAADPAINEQFTITTVLTAGAPTAGADLPDNVSALHIENSGDAVPALDGAANPNAPNRMTVTVDTHTGKDADPYPHAGSVYADAAAGLENSNYAPVAEWSDQMAALTGEGRPGAETVEYVFDIERKH